jgi:diacylglycerol O-acyltransferase
LDIANSEPVNGADAAWLRLDSPANLLVITALAVTEPMGFAEFRQVVQRRFISFRRFLQKPVSHSGLYFWEDDEHFSLDYHVRKVALPAPADKTAMQEYLGELMSTPLDPGKPRWQFLFVENYAGQCAVIMRVHHCYADGLSLIAVFGALTDSAANIHAFPREVAVGDPSGNNPLASRFSNGLKHLIGAAERATRLKFRLDASSDHPFDLPSVAAVTGKSAWQAGLGGVAELARIAALPGDPVTVLKPVPDIMKGCAWSAKIPLQEFRGVASTFGCSINDVLVSIVCAGLRTQLLRHQEVPAETRIHATLPVNLRSLGENSAPDELGNQFGTVFVPLSVGLANPLERLYKTKHDMINLKQSSVPALSHWLMGLVGMLPKGWQGAVLDQFSNKTSLVLSNVPGSRSYRYLAGKKVAGADVLGATGRRPVPGC